MMETQAGPILIGDFLNQLSGQELDDYRRGSTRRDDVLANSGLTAEQQDVLRSNDVGLIRAKIQEEYQSAALHVFAVHVPCNLPGPDNGQPDDPPA